MKVNTIMSRMLNSNMYVISENGRNVLVDPCVAEIEIDNVDYILLTHEHYDHISGVNWWREKTGAKVVASNACTRGCADPRRNFSRYFESFCDIQTWLIDYKVPKVEDYVCEVDVTFENSYFIKWEGHELIIRECPGHSLGSCLIFVDDEIVFSGDSIFKNVKTECGFPGGSKKAWLEKGLPLIEELKNNYVVYPGHFDCFDFKDRFKE